MRQTKQTKQNEQDKKTEQTKHTNLSVFIPHLGCPHRCSFCDQSAITGAVPPSASELSELLEKQALILEKNNTAAEIAFFGGSFTAVDSDYRLELLKTAHFFLKKYPEQYTGLRCSTRPDCIDEKILEELKAYGMTTVELGAQSLSAEVLEANGRGHTPEDVVNASLMIKSYGIKLGLQMMTGLYKDTLEKSKATGEAFVKLQPDCVRIYPTVIIEGTYLAKLYREGVYKSFTLDETVELCAYLLKLFHNNSIPVIRLGLHADPELEKKAIGGVYHPALRELVESRIFLDEILERTNRPGDYIFYSDKRNFSKINGHKGKNKEYLNSKGVYYKLKEEKGTSIRVTPWSK